MLQSAYAMPPQENGTIIKGISEVLCTGKGILVMLKEMLCKPITIIFSNHRSLLQNAAQEPMSGMSSPEPDLAQWLGIHTISLGCWGAEFYCAATRKITARVG